MLLNKFQLHLPISALEAAKLYKELDDVKILAGGTFLMNSLKLLKVKGTRTAQNILSLAKVADLKGIELNNGQLTIKAMTTINELLECNLLKDNLSILHQVCRNISTNPIRNMATIGGNLTCRYTWTEMGAVMIALGANMHFLQPDGTCITITTEDFFKNSARCEALFTHVTILHSTNVKIAYRRVKKTLHVDIPLLAICVRTEINAGQWSNTRVGINNGNAFAQRDNNLESFLNNIKAIPELPVLAMEHLTKEIYDQRSSEYKQHMFRVTLKQAIAEILLGAT